MSTQQEKTLNKIHELKEQGKTLKEIADKLKSLGYHLEKHAISSGYMVNRALNERVFVGELSDTKEVYTHLIWPIE